MTAPTQAEPKPSELVLRDLELRDIEQVAEFEAAIARRSFADEAVTDLAHYRKKLGKLVKYGGDWTKVAERDGVIVGWAWVAPRQNFITGDDYADFRSFYVDGQRAGSAASVMLLRAVLAHATAAGYTRIVGRTATSNEAMRALYRLAGFEEKHVVYELEIGGVGRDLG
ncbi:GNAT family N-acetyltransferase [Aurantimonas aggregata]|uniref:GNAT family N-acetyltransferase n=1 Tax=Aurantimonas aggregata TaxID=2047720 RepID=A0A6L9MC64_9HYPH|nr:GNAT family N-acetyltransferase [Aurantimonas aggregata]NDV85268.1 GNAT family N-acetyltransferase [Aurantimonas aggregata]